MIVSMLAKQAIENVPIADSPEWLMSSGLRFGIAIKRQLTQHSTGD